jgi:hypothetical protein
MPVDSTNLSTLFLVLTAWGAAFLLALWIGLIVWTYRDIRSRSRDSFLRILAVVLVLLLFIPGIVVYLLLRPPRTLDDEYQQTLEEEALLQAVEDSPLCPGCARRVKELWMVCPSCHTKLKKPCHVCGKLMELPWNLCPYCGTPTPGMRREGMTMDDALRTLPMEGDEDVEGGKVEG